MIIADAAAIAGREQPSIFPGSLARRITPELAFMRMGWTLSFIVVAGLPACASGSRSLPPASGVTWQAANAADATAIIALFDSTAAGWNRGDLAAYMSAYADSASGNGAGDFDRGKAAIERTMRAGFWRTGRPAQALRYESLRVRMLGPNYALVNGKFVLSGAGRPDRTGLFSTVWARTQEGWRMINDHSG
jgi:uncharacterized protein (TIGR02246 family)